MIFPDRIDIWSRKTVDPLGDSKPAKQLGRVSAHVAFVSSRDQVGLNSPTVRTIYRVVAGRNLAPYVKTLGSITWRGNRIEVDGSIEPCYIGARLAHFEFIGHSVTY